MKKTKTQDQSFKVLKNAFTDMQGNHVKAIKAQKKLKNAINQTIPISISKESTDDNMTLLHHAVEMDSLSLEMLDALLEAGADVNQLNKFGHSPLANAVDYNADLNIIRRLVDDSKMQKETIIQALSRAIIRGNLTTLNLLLDCLQSRNVNIPELLVTLKTNSGSLFVTSIVAERFEITYEFLKYYENKQNDNQQSGNNQNYLSQDPEILAYILLRMEDSQRVLDMVQRLINAGADVSQISPSINASPLDIATEKHNINVVKMILARDPKAKQTTALRSALAKKDREMIRLLLEAGADVNQRIYSDGMSEFTYACIECDFKNLDLLLPYTDKQDINICCYYAAQVGYCDIVDLLLHHGADANAVVNINPESKDKDEHKMMHVAVCHGHLDIIHLLLQRGATVKDDPYLLFTAAQYDSLEVVKLLLDAEADPNFSFDNFLPLENASSHGQYEIAQELINRGAKITADAVYFAAANGHFDLIYLFAKHDADIACTSISRNESPLHAAVRDNHILAASALIQHGASIEALSTDGLNDTPMHIACMNGHIDCIELLFEAGAEGNLPNAENLCPLHIAVMNNKLAVIEYLLTKEKIELYPLKGISTTPIALAASMGNAEAFDLIYKKAKSLNQMPDTETWIDCFSGLLPANQTESKKKLGLFLRLLNELSSEEIIAIFTAEGPDSVFDKLSKFNAENKVYFQQYLRFFLNHCKNKSIIFPTESKESFLQAASALGLGTEMNKLFVEPETSNANDNANDNGNANASVTKPPITPKPHVPFSQMMSLFHQMQDLDVVRVRKPKITKLAPALKQFSLLNNNVPAKNKCKYTWGNGLIDSETIDKNSELCVKTADSSTNQFFYCPANITTLLENHNVLSVFSAVMAYPKIVRLVNQPGLKPLNIDYPPIDINIIDPVTNKVVTCKGKISHEVKILHANFATERLLCVSIGADGGRGSLIVPVMYLPNGLHGNDDVKSLAEKLKNTTSFDVIAPHQTVQPQLAMTS